MTRKQSGPVGVVLQNPFIQADGLLCRVYGVPVPLQYRNDPEAKRAAQRKRGPLTAAKWALRVAGWAENAIIVCHSPKGEFVPFLTLTAPTLSRNSRGRSQSRQTRTPAASTQSGLTRSRRACQGFKGQHGLSMSDCELAYSSFDCPTRVVVINRAELQRDGDTI